jgi:SNF2 family DNA or RNA helicase
VRRLVAVAAGTIELVGIGGHYHWQVEAPPYVLHWIRKLNASCDRFQQKGRVHILASVDKTAELEWVRERFPLTIKEGVSIELWEKQIDKAHKRAEAVEQVLGAGYEPPAFALAEPAREYQKIAADLFLRTGHLLLADQVGLGKTISAIAALTDPKTRPALVVTMAHLTRQWQRELARFLPSARVHVLKKGTSYDLRTLHGLPDVIVGNYHKLHGWEGTLAGKVKAVVFDECQELRRTDSNKYSAARGIAHGAEMAMGLSATPVYNYGSEIWAIMDVLAPGSLGSKADFERDWCKNGNGQDSKPVEDPEALGSWLRSQGLMLLRTRRDVGRELPDLSSVVQETDVDLSAIEAVEDRLTELARLIESGSLLTTQERFAAATEIDWKMREATGVAKAPFVCDFVRLLCESGERVLLYGWHHAVYDIWRSKLADLKPVEFTGEQSLTQKEAAKNAILHGDAQVLIMSLRAGAGLDGLQHRVRTVVFGELDWSPAVHEQAAGRVHRDGQRDPVVAYYCVSRSGSDPVLSDTLGLKEAQSQGIRGAVQGETLFGAGEEGKHAQKLARAILEKRGRAAKRA